MLKSFKFGFGAVLAASLLLCGCDEDLLPITSTPEEESLFENSSAELDSKNSRIELPKDVDSLIVGSLNELGGSKYYLALDGDPVDPEIDWDSPLSSGTVIKAGEQGFANIVVLDDADRVVGVWQIKVPEVKSSSSSEEIIDSSSSEDVKSSDSDAAESSASESAASSAVAESSSSEEIAESSSSEEIVESSSSEEVAESSSDVVESSAAAESAESSAASESAASSSDQVPASSALTTAESSSDAVIESSVETPQLPGTDFTKRDDSFWATTSDIMAESKTAATVKFASSANLEFEGGKATLTTREIVGSWIGVSGAWKVAGGFYFAGTFEDTDIVHLYQWNYTSGTPDAGYASDISQGMTFGRPFTARPTSFEIKYSYEHVDNTSDDYPQKSLVYVMLVSAKKKVVACGMLSDASSVSNKTKTVNLNYGRDPSGLLTGGYPIAEGLTLGDGTEEVASIHVMFASSAYAHVVAGGAAGTGNKQRGGKNAKLVLDNFKLNY